MFAEIGTRQDETRILSEMCHSLFALGDDAQAERGWREALRLTGETRSMFAALDALSGIAALRARQGNIEQAKTFDAIVNDALGLADFNYRASPE